MNEAARLLDPLVSSDEFVEFLTGPAYEIVTTVVGTEQIAAWRETTKRRGSL